MFWIGFDVGGTTIDAGVFDGSMNLAARRTIPFPRGKEYTEAASQMAALAIELAAELGGGPEIFEAMGVVVAGSVDAEGQKILHGPNLGYRDVPFRAAMEAHFPGLPVNLENDAYGALLAEYYMGALRGCHTGILLTLGTGVGSGLVLDGKPFKGGQGHGTEAGHMTFSYGGKRCACGNNGCLETMCSAGWLISEGQKQVTQAPEGLLFKKTGGKAEKVTAKLVIDCAKAGDLAAEGIFFGYVDQLGDALASLANLLDPEVIVIGGGIAQSGNFLFRPLQKALEEKSFFHSEYPVVPAVTGANAGITGAALLFQDRL